MNLRPASMIRAAVARALPHLTAVIFSTAAAADCKVEPVSPAIHQLSNGLVTVRVHSLEGRLLSLSDAQGREFMKSGPLDFNWVDAAGKRHFGTTLVGGKAAVAIAEKDIVSVESHFPRQAEGLPCDVTIRYTVVAGVPGVYAEAKLHHRADAPAFELEQLRFCYLTEPAVGGFGRTPLRHAPLPSVKMLDDAILLVQPEAMWMPNGVIDCKYDWCTNTRTRGVFGIHNQERGLWMIEGSLEYANGGPWKQSLNLHQTRSPLAAPVLQGMLHSRHFLDGAYSMMKVAAGEDWKKEYGPLLLLATTGDADAQWQAAVETHGREAAAWPPAWSWAGKHSRSLVRGRLVDSSGSPLAGAEVLLADAAEPSLPPIEASHFTGRQAWFGAKTNADGRFEIPKVMSGAYSFYAWQDGKWQGMRRDGVAVTGAEADLGSMEFPADDAGRLLWQLGTPDRSGSEFFRGHGRLFFGRHATLREDFPDGVHFKVGADDSAKSWNWAMLPIPQDDGTCRPSRWTLRFDATADAVSKAVLSVALASSSGNASKPISLRLNGQVIGEIPLRSDTALWFGSTRGAVRSSRFEFDGSLLRAGENELEILNPNTWVFAGVVWDALKLEIIE